MNLNSKVSYFRSTLVLLAALNGWTQILFAQTEAAAEPMPTTVTVACNIESYYRTDMMSRLESYVGQVFVDLGDVVKKGDALVELDAPEIKAAVRQHEKLVEKAEADVNAVAAEIASVQARTASLEARKNLRTSELTRMRRLVSSGVLTTAKQDEAEYAHDAVLADQASMRADMKAVEAKLVASEATVEVAHANLDHAKAMAQYLTIRAPFGGVITKRNVDPGAFVRPPSGDKAMPLVQLEDIDRVRVIIMVPYAVAGGVDVGNKVVISGIRGQEGVQIEGKITRIGTGFEQGSRMMRAEVVLDNQPTESGKRPLRSGDYGSATIRMK